MNVNLPYLAGLACGLLVVGIACFVVFKLAKKITGKGRREYDERQQLCQGRAYKAAYYTLIGYLCFAGVFDLSTGIKWCDQFTSLMLGMFLSVGVFAVMCIFTDAYMPLHFKPTGTLIILTGLGIMNIGIGLVNHAPFIENGILTYRSINFLAGITLIFVALLLLIKILIEKRAEQQ